MMTEHIPYPSNYTDPEPDTPRVQCTECGEWKDAEDMATVDEVQDLMGFILQGVCLGCDEIALAHCTVCGEWKDMPEDMQPGTVKEVPDILLTRRPGVFILQGVCLKCKKITLVDENAGICHSTGISGRCGEDCEAYMIYDQCGYLEERNDDEIL